MAGGDLTATRAHSVEGWLDELAVCATLDLTGLTTLAWFTASAPGAVAAAPAALAAASSLVRLPAAAVASRRCLAATRPGA
jgi:hypothetical protein